MKDDLPFDVLPISKHERFRPEPSPDPRELQIDPEMMELLQSVANKIGATMPPGFGFTMLLYTITDETNSGRSVYFVGSPDGDGLNVFREWYEHQTDGQG